MKLKAIIMVATMSLMSGCISNNVKTYKADVGMKNEVPHSNMGKLFVKSVTMPHDDTNSIMCRAAGNIYLPNKMTYSQYIHSAFRNSLSAMDKAAESAKDGHSMSIVLTKVTFDSLSGEWYIDAQVTVDNGAPVSINTVNVYGTSYSAMSACKNTAEAFDEAVANFIKQVLNKPEISRNLTL